MARSKKAGLDHVKRRPMDAIVENALTTARQHRPPLNHRQTRLVGQLFSCIRHTGFAIGGELQDGKHQGLVIGNCH